MTNIKELINHPTNAKHASAILAMLPAFEDAVVYCEQKAWIPEWRAIQKAFKIAKSYSTLKGSSWFSASFRILENEGLVFRDSKFLGTVAPFGVEQNFVLTKESSLFDLPPAIYIRSDRILSKDDVRSIDKFTSASVFVDGVDQSLKGPH